MTDLPDHELLRRYLTGTLTAPEEAELERRARGDDLLAAAMGGLRSVPEADHAARVRNMISGARAQVESKDRAARKVPLRPRPYRPWAVAATLLLLVVTSLLLLPELLDRPAADLAQQKEVPTAAPPPPPQTDVQPPPPAKPPAPEEQTVVAETIRRTAPAVSEPNPTPAPPPEPAARAAADPPPAPAPAAATAAPPAPIIEPQPLERTTEALPPPAPTTAAVTQTGYLAGTVTNENGVPVAGAELRLSGLPTGQTTDSNGYFRLPIGAGNRLIVTHPAYETTDLTLDGRPADVQIALDRKPFQRPERPYNPNPGTTIDLGNRPPAYARPAEGFANLRRRLEAQAPDSLARGRYRFSFLVNTDGTLTDFEFRGRPPRPVMDYLGTALVQTSAWEIVSGDEPVRIYFRVRLR